MTHFTFTTLDAPEELIPGENSGQAYLNKKTELRALLKMNSTGDRSSSPIGSFYDGDGSLNI